MLDRAAVEFVEILAGCARVDIEHMHVHIRVFLAHEHGVFGRVHAADLGTILLALDRVRGAARTTHWMKHDLMRMLAVRRTNQFALGRAGGVHDAFEFQRSDHVLGLAIGILVKGGGVDGLKPGRQDDGAVLALEDLVFLIKLDRPGRAIFLAQAALSGTEVQALGLVDNGDIRDGLRKRNIDRAARVQAHVEFVQALAGGALFRANAAAVHLVSST